MDFYIDSTASTDMICLVNGKHCFFFLDYYLFESHSYRREEDEEKLPSVGHSPIVCNSWSWVRLKPRARTFSRSPRWVQGSKALGHLPLAFQPHQQGARLEMEHLGHKLSARRSAGVSVDNFSCCSTVMVLVIYFTDLFIWKGVQRRRDMEIFPSAGSFSWTLQKSLLCLAEASSPELLLPPYLLHGYRGQSTWISVPCFPRGWSRELGRMWSSQDFSWYLCGVLVLQVVALPTWPVAGLWLLIFVEYFS